MICGTTTLGARAFEAGGRIGRGEGRCAVKRVSACVQVLLATGASQVGQEAGIAVKGMTERWESRFGVGIAQVGACALLQGVVGCDLLAGTCFGRV